LNISVISAAKNLRNSFSVIRKFIALNAIPKRYKRSFLSSVLAVQKNLWLEHQAVPLAVKPLVVPADNIRLEKPRFSSLTLTEQEPCVPRRAAEGGPRMSDIAASALLVHKVNE
jgi:hypothetical protein